MTSERRSWLWLVKLKKQTNRAKEIFFLYLRFSVIKPENIFFQPEQHSQVTLLFSPGPHWPG